MSDYAFGYCTNVHAGVTLEQAQNNLQRIATRVRHIVAPKGRLPVGLWLAQQAATQLRSAHAVQQLADWLEAHGLLAYTFNGFPQGDFHQPVVKHAVYEPTWLDESRLVYTQTLADILAGLLAPGKCGSISTLPLGWPHQPWRDADFRRAGDQLRRLATHLDNIAQQTGHEIVLAIEPEPGCVLDTAEKIVEFFTRYVVDSQSPYIARHITICHDICHSAVMFESQATALQLYRDHELRIGKVQVSSAIEVPWPQAAGDAALLRKMAAQLRTFNEPRYLHQTTRQQSIQPARGRSQLQMVEDLGVALAQWLPVDGSSAWPDSAWRIHFHVPIFVKQFGQLMATQADIAEVVAIMQQHQQDSVAGANWFTGDYEVETYAWNVLPDELQGSDLATGIANELQYFSTLLTPQHKEHAH